MKCTSKCGRLNEGGYATEHGMDSIYEGSGLLDDTCGRSTTHRVPARGGDIYLCTEHAEEHATRFPGTPIEEVA
jgi:hypothetical protein